MPARTACRERPPMTPSPTAAGHAPSTTPGARILAMGEYVENPVAEAFGNVTGLALPATCGTTMPSATTCQRPGVLPVTRCVKATRPEPGRTRRNDASGDRQDAGALACGGRRHGRAASGGQSQAGHVAEGFGNRVLDVLTHREDARARCGAGCVARGCGARRHRRSLPAGGPRRHSWAPGRTGLPARPGGECARRGRREGVLPPYSPEGEGRAPGGRNERPGLRAHGSGRLRCRWIGGGGADRAPVGRHGAGAPPRAGHRTTRVLLRGLLRRPPDALPLGSVVVRPARRYPTDSGAAHGVRTCRSPRARDRCDRTPGAVPR